jgi:hypothetical protein
MKDEGGRMKDEKAALRPHQTLNAEDAEDAGARREKH